MEKFSLKNWKTEPLSFVCSTISAGGDKPLVFSKIKTKECTIPIYSNGVKDNGLYGFTNKATITEAAITVSARGTIGYVCKRMEPYCPIIRLITVIPDKDKITLDFLYYALKHMIPLGSGASIPQLTVPQLKQNLITYPISLDIQNEIVDKLNNIYQQTWTLEKIYEQKLKDLNELKQSILQKAFRGEL